MIKGGVLISQPSLHEDGLHTPTGASEWLVSRARVRQPSGAMEYLTAGDREERRARTKLARHLSLLYREFFPRQYHLSPQPFFSLEREHEFYNLVNQVLFPLDLRPLEQHRDWMYPVIPIRCQQPHDWFSRDYTFEHLEPPFQLTHALFDADSEGFWRMLRRHYGLPESPRPLPYGRTNSLKFVELCVAESTPLRHLPTAIVMQSYRTGSMWLDIPPGMMAGESWTFDEVHKLHVHWVMAKRMFHAIDILSEWLIGAPAERFGRAVQLWNMSAN